MKQILIVFLWMLSLRGLAQETHVIEPSILEVRYEVTHEKDKDMYVLRCGKNVSQYFSLNKLRDDSLRASPDPAMRNIVLDEMLEAAMHRDDPTKQRPTSPGHGEFLYWNLTEGKVSVYTSIFGSKYLVEEDIPVMDWEIVEDSVQTILGYECHKATTAFRGRVWTVWYAEDIPVSLGPWKLNGLPGMILQAECNNYIIITASSITTSHLTPVTFYNFLGHKFEPVEREKYMKMKNNPNAYPSGTIMTPPMELE
jgi:GLPGLI family protein